MRPQPLRPRLDSRHTTENLELRVVTDRRDDDRPGMINRTFSAHTKVALARPQSKYQLVAALEMSGIRSAANDHFLTSSVARPR
jgi:hypothetical protein